MTTNPIEKCRLCSLVCTRLPNRIGRLIMHPSRHKFADVSVPIEKCSLRKNRLNPQPSNSHSLTKTTSNSRSLAL